jgi:septal ring factor EnvC (AmiA/AmiB activator)
MPKLYGNKFKPVLRKEIRELEVSLRKTTSELFRTRRDLQYAECKIEALEAKLRRVEQKTQELVTEIGGDVGTDIQQRYLKIIRVPRAA